MNNINLYDIAQCQISSSCNNHFYLLLDHAGMPGLRNQLKASSLRWESLFKETAESSAQDAGPILVLVGSEQRLHMTRRLLKWIDKAGRYRSTIVMLSSTESFDVIFSKLVARLDVCLAGGLQAMLRYYDPRVLEGLVETLTDAQKSSFFGIAHQWAYVNRVGDTIFIKIAFKEKSDDVAPMCLTQVQEDNLLMESEVDQVMNIIKSRFPELIKSIPPRDQYTEILKSAKMARNERGLSIIDIACNAVNIILAKRN